MASYAPLWKMGTFLMRPHFEPRNMDVSLFQARLRMTQDDRYNQNDEIMNKIGGPGKMFFVSNYHPGVVYSYDVYQWLDISNRSIPSLVKELNAIFVRYFREVLRWDWQSYDLYAPKASIAVYKGNWHHILLRASSHLDNDTINKLSVKIMVDPNLAIALKMVGYNWKYTENDWFRILVGNYNFERHTLELSRVSNWDELGQSAAFPVQKVAYINWFWDVLYSIDIMAGLNPTCECLAYRQLRHLSREEQVIQHLKNVILPDWKIDEHGGIVINKVLILEYRANKLDPSIRQMVMQFTTREDWYKMSFSFSRLLIQLFNWNERYLENGNTITVEHGTYEFYIDFTHLHPPSYDFLNDTSLIHTENMDYQHKRIQLLPESKKPAMIINAPSILPTEDRIVGIYHLSIDAPHVFSIPPREHLCIMNGIERCTHTELVFDLHLAPGDRRSYSLQSLSFVIKGRIKNADGTSIIKGAPIQPVGPLFSSMVKNVQVTIASNKTEFVIDTSNGLYSVRDSILTLIRPPLFDEKNDKENKDGIIAGSREFSVRIYPFKFNSAPSDQLFTSKELTVSIAFHKANKFIVNEQNPKSAYSFELNRDACRLDVKDSICFNDDITHASEYVRYRHECLYDFTQFNIKSHIIPKGHVEYTVNRIMKRTKARTWYVALRKSVGHDIFLPENMKFELFDLARMDLKEGNVSIDGPIYLSNENPYGKHSIYRRFQRTRLDHGGREEEEISEDSFFKDKTIFVFHREAHKVVDDFISINVFFLKPLPFDVELICLAEVSDHITLDYLGEVSSHIRSNDKDEHHIRWHEDHDSREHYIPPPKSIKECRNDLIEMDADITTTQAEFLTVREHKYKAIRYRELDDVPSGGPPAPIARL